MGKNLKIFTKTYKILQFIYYRTSDRTLRLETMNNTFLSTKKKNIFFISQSNWTRSNCMDALTPRDRKISLLSIRYTVCIKESSTIRRNHASKEYSRISVSEPRQFWTFWSIVRPRVDYLIQRFQRRIIPPIRWTIPFDPGVNRSLLFLETILETNGISMESCRSAKL